MNVRRIVPNALTMGNLLGGAFVCWAAASGEDISDGRVALVWLGAMFFDVLDGWAARKLGVEGPMGVQLDSLADLVTGGLAPSFVAYRLMSDGGMMGEGVIVVLPAMLVVAAAYRLARYNVKAAEGGTGGFFEGLPAPAAGVFWMGMAMWWGVADGGIEGGTEIRVMLVVAGLGMLVVPLLMVLKRPFFSLKGWGKDVKADRLRWALVGIVGATGLGTWFAWGNVYAAAPLCVLLYASLAFIFAPSKA